MRYQVGCLMRDYISFANESCAEVMLTLIRVKHRVFT